VSDPRYAIGIDLGTTHSALSYVNLQASDGEKTQHGVLAIPQLTAPGTIEELPLLPSFLYLPHADELAPGENNLPWQQSAEEQTGVAGEMARSRGATTPIRLVSSAKSWLSHPGVDRRAPSCRTTRRKKWRACRRWKPRPATCRTCARRGNRRTLKRRSASRR
jgi:molecular chaperone DnaK (HSP70)